MLSISQIKEFPEVFALYRDNETYYMAVDGGRLAVPIAPSQAITLMEAAQLHGLITRRPLPRAGRERIYLRPGNSLASLLNPPSPWPGNSLLALVKDCGRWLAWVKGDGAVFRVIEAHEANLMMRRARGLHSRTMPLILDETAGALLFDPENDLAAELQPELTPQSPAWDEAAWRELVKTTSINQLRQRVASQWRQAAVSGQS